MNISLKLNLPLLDLFFGGACFSACSLELLVIEYLVQRMNHSYSFAVIFALLIACQLAL